MIKQEIIEYFQKNKDGRAIPKINNLDWKKLISTYEKDDIRDSLSEYIVSNNVSFPFKQVDEQEVKNLFIKFYNKSMLDEYKNFDVVEERY
jgi:hypothetical protein